MQFSLVERVLYLWPQPLLGLLILAALALAWIAGTYVRRYASKGAADDDQGRTHEGYVVSAVLGLLALLMGFTFSMASDRFDRRRGLVLEEANAITATYLMAQTFKSPDRERLSSILSAYVDNRLVAARTDDLAVAREEVAKSDALQMQFWAASLAATANLRDDISSSFLQSGGEMIQVGEARVAARRALIPKRVHGVLLVYMAITAGVLGFALGGTKGRTTAAIMLLLLTLSLVLIIDLDRPTSGAIVESQRAMEDLQAQIRGNPPDSLAPKQPTGNAAAAPPAGP